MAGAIRVLAVEDDPAARAVLRAVLDSLDGVELCGLAADGMEGLELVEKLRQMLQRAEMLPEVEAEVA